MAKKSDKILSPIKTRIEQFADNKGINKEILYKEIGVASSNFRGKSGLSELGGEAIAKILSRYLDLNADWLITGKGEMTRGEKGVIKLDNPEAFLLKVGVPLVRTEALGGIGNTDFRILEEDVLDRYVVPDFNQIDFMMRVKGSSMWPKFNAGDVVACRILKEKTFLQWNMTHVIATDEQGILIKRIKKGSTPDQVLLSSDNKDYDPFEVPWSGVKGIALVIGVIRLE